MSEVSLIGLLVDVDAAVDDLQEAMDRLPKDSPFMQEFGGVSDRFGLLGDMHAFLSDELERLSAEEEDDE